MKNKSKNYFLQNYQILKPFNNFLLLKLLIDTGEKKTIEKDEPKLTFFNFFTTLRMPSVDEMKTLDYETEKELGAHLDNEYELGIEFVDELIPYSTEYFVGVTHDSEEFGEYMHERTMEEQEKAKDKRKNKH